jgi:N4-gp56 family major capsid protein
MSITTVNQLPPAVREYYDRLLLMTAFPKLIHTKFAQKRILPRKNGDTIVFRRYAKLDTVPVPLVDGITPPGAQLSVTDLKSTVSFYGNFVTFTNQVELTVEDRVLNEATKLLSQNMGQTIDEVTRDCLASTSSILACSHGLNGGTPTELTKQDIDAATKTLLSNDAEMISEIIKGTSAFATTPVRPSFFGFIDTDLLDDLENVSNFVSTANYASQDKSIMDSEWGNTGNVRWLYTSAGSVSSASPAVYNNFIVGKEAYGVVHLGSETGEFYVKQLGSAGSADPLNQRGSVGWQHPFVARILNDSFMINLMATHS